MWVWIELGTEVGCGVVFVLVLVLVVFGAGESEDESDLVSDNENTICLWCLLLCDQLRNSDYDITPFMRLITSQATTINDIQKSDEEEDENGEADEDEVKVRCWYPFCTHFSLPWRGEDEE